jgi:uncharacterized protein (DUF433 family)
VRASLSFPDFAALNPGYEVHSTNPLEAITIDPFEAITIQRAMTTSDRIVIDPAISHGRPVIRGSRVPVTVVVGSLAGGMTFEEIEREYDLSAEDIRAALKFVAEIAEQESFHPLPAA